MTSKQKEEVFEIPDRLQVFDDPRTKAKTIALPFQFPDATSGILMVSRLAKGLWRPNEVISRITVTFKDVQES